MVLRRGSKARVRNPLRTLRKLPSNASQAKSGARKDFLRQAAKLEVAAQRMLAKHRAADANLRFRGAARDCVPCALRRQCLRHPQRSRTRQVAFFLLRHNKRLDRFTLRGGKKVDGQWPLYCLTHNIEKLAHHGHAA